MNLGGVLVGLKYLFKILRGGEKKSTCMYHGPYINRAFVDGGLSVIGTVSGADEDNAGVSV